MPVTLRHLSVQTSTGRLVVNTFHCQDAAPRGLLICLPGQSYGCDGPLLYYTKRLLQDRGWDALGLTYGFQTTMADLSAETLAECLAEAKALARAGMSERAYPRVGLVGKSLGASALAWLTRDEQSLASARSAYLTPLLGTPMFDAAFGGGSGPAYLAIGTLDRFYDSGALERLQSQRAFRLRIVEGQDHAFDFDGELESSLRDLRVVVEDLVDFFDADEPAGQGKRAA
jgi:hypothetical protein